MPGRGHNTESKRRGQIHPIATMARLARVVIPGMPHHVTQRRNRRQQTFFHDSDYATYM